jgi:multiple sugar transport system substrate-binding protein
MKRDKFLAWLALSVLLLLVACSGVLPSVPSPTTLPSAQATASVTPASGTLAPPTTVVSPTQATATPTQAGPTVLRLWLPPQFDPNSGTPAGDLLKQQLETFSQRRPNVQVEVRIKALDGPGGLLDSLTNASAAAPLALPDVVALPRPDLETAALKGLLHPFDGLTPAMDDSDWYDYARQLGRLQNSTFGLPFAGDAMMLVYYTSQVPKSPADWGSVLGMTTPLAFAAADPQSLFTLAQYQAEGGAVRDDQGRPFLDPAALEKVLRFYLDASKNGVMPTWLTQLQNDDQVWEAFKERRASSAIAWNSLYFNQVITNTSAAPLPTENGKAFTLATGWVWALASSQPDRLEMGAQLAEFLTDTTFLATWTQAAGYLPPRPSSLDAWTNKDQQLMVRQIVLSASLYPSADIITSLGPPIQQATIQVLKQQTDPQTAAQQAAASLVNP